MNDAVVFGRWTRLLSCRATQAQLGTRETEQRQFDIITKYASALVTVTDAEAIAALVALLSEEKSLTEPATSCSIAALLSAKVPLAHGDNVVVVLCGANVSIDRVGEWICEGSHAHLTRPLAGK